MNWKGPSYPFYYPYWDVDEKFPPTELFGTLTSIQLETIKP